MFLHQRLLTWVWYQDTDSQVITKVNLGWKPSKLVCWSMEPDHFQWWIKILYFLQWLWPPCTETVTWEIQCQMHEKHKNFLNLWWFGIVYLSLVLGRSVSTKGQLILLSIRMSKFISLSHTMKTHLKTRNLSSNRDLTHHLME